MKKDKTEAKESGTPSHSNKRLRKLTTVLAVFAVVAITALAAYPLLPAPTVRGYTLKGSSRNISVNAPLKVTFDQLMDNSSVEKAFRVEPNISGKFEWHGNSVSFRPDEPLKIGETYKVTIDKQAASILKKPMSSDYVEYYKVVAAPKVVLITPENDSKEISTDAQINIMFDRPMTGFTSLEAGRENFPKVNIEPSVNGQFKWLGTSTLQFKPEKLASATTYKVTVPKGTLVLDGGYTEEEFVSSFETIRPLAHDMSVSDTMDNSIASAKSSFFISFNQKIDLADASTNIALYPADNKNAPESITVRDFTMQDWKSRQKHLAEMLEMHTYEEIPVDNENPTKSAPEVETPSNVELAKMSVITPTQPLKPGTKYVLEVKKGLKSGEGLLTTLEENKFEFTVMDEFKLISSINDSENSDSLANIVFKYSNPVDLRSLRGKISISPEIRDENDKPAKPRVETDENGEVRINYDFLPSKDYTLTVAAGVKDISGNTINQASELKFTTNAYKPALSLETGTDFSVLDSNKESLFYLKSVNIDSVDWKLKRLSSSEFASLYFDGYINYRDINISQFGIPDWDGVMPIKLGFNERGHTPFNLDKLTGSKLENGFYYMEISNPKVQTTVCLQKWESDTPGCHEEPQIIRNLFVISNTSLALKSSSDQIVVWATDMKDGKPVSNKHIRVLDKESNAVAEGHTDSNGVAKFKIDVKDDNYYADYMVFAESDNDVGFVHSTWMEGIAPWNFDLDHNYVSPKYYTYFYTERPIYRPGQDVYFKGIVRQEKDYKFQLPTAKKVRVTVKDTNGNEIYNKDLTLSNNGTFEDKLTLGSNIPTGDFYAQAEILGVSGPEWLNKSHSYFKVYEYRKPEYKLDIVPDRKDYLNGQNASINVQASYFFGAPLSDAPIKWTLRSHDYYFFLPEELASKLLGSWFSFADEGFFCYWGCQGGDEIVSQGTTKADSSGKATISLPLNLSNKKMSQIYTLEVSVSDANNQNVSDRVSFPVHQGEHYLGIRSFDYIVNTDSPAKFEVLAVSHDGKALSGKQADITLYERNWNTVKRKNVDGDYYFENTYDDKEIAKKSVSTDADGLAVAEFSIKKSGVYKVQVSGKDGAGNLIKSSTTVYVSSEDFVNWGFENNDKIELVTDKMEYKVGDTAKILIKSPYKNVYALVTQERDKVFDYKVIKLESNSDTIEIPITEKFLPNAFVSVVVMKGSSYDAGLNKPAEGSPDFRNVASFKTGYTTLQVNTESKKLQIEISSDKKLYAPREKVKLNFVTKDHSGKPVPAELSVAVVDESVLSLTESVTADLLNVFYRKRILGVKLAHTLTKALSRVNVQVEAGMKGGGGGDLAKRGVFKDTAIFKSTLLTNASGEGNFEFELPDNLTTWQVLAIGVSDDTNNAKTLVGSNKFSFLSTKDILIRPVLPRFFTSGDKMKISAIIHNYTEESQNIQVKLDVEGVVIDDGGVAQNVSVEAKGSKKVDWMITVGKTGKAKLTYTAEANGGKSDSIEHELPIKDPSMPEIVAMSKVLSDGDRQIEQVWLPKGLNVENGYLKISAAPTLLGAVLDGLDYLRVFPYSCSEQVASAILPNVALKRLINTNKLSIKNIDEKALDEQVNIGLQQLYKNQQASGGFGLWITSDADAYLTAYVALAIFEAKQASFSVDQKVIDSAKKYLNEYLTQKDNSKFSLEHRLNTRAFVLYVLSELGENDTGSLNSLYEQRENLSLASHAYLLMAYHKSGGSSEAKISALREKLENSAIQTPRGATFQEPKPNMAIFDTNTRTTALIFKALHRVDPTNPLLPKVIQSLLQERKGGHFSSTQETALSLLAMLEYLEQSKELSPAFQAAVDLNGKNIMDMSFKKDNLFEMKKVELPLSDLLADNLDNELAAQKSGEGKLYYDMNLKYYLPLAQLGAKNEGMEILQEYFAIDDRKLERPLQSIKVGQNVRARLTLIVPEDRHYVMIEDFLPAGLEGVDFNLKTSEQSLKDTVESDEASNETIEKYCYECDNNRYFNHTEVRDDRMMYFADYLPRGVYELDYYMRATSVGEFADLPVLAQETYFPEVFGRSAGGFFRVTE